MRSIASLCLLNAVKVCQYHFVCYPIANGLCVVAHGVLVCHVAMPKQGITVLPPAMLEVVVYNSAPHGFGSVSDLCHHAGCQRRYDSPRRFHQRVEPSLVVTEKVDLRFKSGKKRQTVVEIRLRIYCIVTGAGSSRP
jgi:hypothetical protein